MKKILITGATGNIAGVTIHHLASSGTNIRALVHNKSKAEQLKQMKFEIVYGDFGKPQTLGAAFKGVDKVLLITPVSLDAARFASNAIAAAKQSGTPHIFYISSNVPVPVNESEVGRQRTAIEAELMDSGLPYTIIRPTFFMQNTMMAAQTVASDGTVYLPFSEGQLPMLDIRDVGEVTAKLLMSAGHDGKTYTLTGPASISLNDVASVLSSTLGKNVAYVNVPFEASKQAMMGMGMPDWMADMYNELFKNFGSNGANFVTDDVETIKGSPAIPYSQFVQDFATAFST